MRQVDWIRSYGGPLICMDKGLKRAWGGIERLTIETNTGAGNDYERACQCNLLLGSIPLDMGEALVLGDHPLQTSFWRAADDRLHIVRIRWAEPWTDVDSLLSAANISALPSVQADIPFTFSGPDIVLFDSVEDGSDDHIAHRQISAGGRYAISTKIFEPDGLTSLYINEFRAI